VDDDSWKDWPDTMTYLVATVLAVSACVAVFVRRAIKRRDLVAGLRATWGKARAGSRNVPAMVAYHELRTTSGGRASLDDRTWDDLGLDEVFAGIDHTQSTIGQQALYHRLRTAPVGDDREAFEALIQVMSTDLPARERAQVTLSRLRDPAGYDLWWLTQPDALGSRRWHIVFPLWTSAILVAALLVAYHPFALLVVIAATVLNFWLRIATASRVGAIVGSFRQLGPVIAAAEDLAFLDTPDTRPLTTALQADVRTLARLKNIARWVSRDPLAVGEPVASILEYLNVLYLLDLNAMYFAARELSTRGPALLRVITAVGEVDAAVSVASFRAGASGWTRPVFDSQAPLSLTNIRHPLLADPVPNSIVLGPPHGMLVTGSNMSGKSTFLRAVGVATVMAQTINTCLADAYTGPLLRVRSCIGRSDDLAAGKSYYMVEAEAALDMVRTSASADPHLFIIDELFRGTNASERIAAAEAVLVELVRDHLTLKPHIVIVATHDGELVDLLRDDYAPYHLTDVVTPEGLSFDYRLRPGPSTTRNAITLLRLRGAPERLVRRALDRAAALDRERAMSNR
jgi:hypothetical protein